MFQSEWKVSRSFAETTHMRITLEQHRIGWKTFPFVRVQLFSSRSHQNWYAKRREGKQQNFAKCCKTLSHPHRHRIFKRTKEVVCTLFCLSQLVVCFVSFRHLPPSDYLSQMVCTFIFHWLKVSSRLQAREIDAGHFKVPVDSNFSIFSRFLSIKEHLLKKVNLYTSMSPCMYHFYISAVLNIKSPSREKEKLFLFQ